MKKLYFLDKEEKSRILNLHESATKNQYLIEKDLTADDWKNSIAKANATAQLQLNPLGAIADPEIRKAMFGTNTVEAAITNPDKKAERIKNISKIVCSLKGDTITSKGSQFNGKSWVDYVTRFKITSTEEAQAKKLCSTGGDERLYNIAKIACSVDATGKIVNAKSKFNGKMFTDYISTYKLSGAEVTKAKTLCGKLGNQPTADVGKVNSPANVGSKSNKGNKGSSAAAIAPNIQAVQKQLGIQNGTGTLDTATLQAMLSKLNGVQVAAPAAAPQQTVSSVVPAGVVPAGSPASAQLAQLGQTPQQMQQMLNNFTNRPQ
jgi:hypothetical protein